MRLERKHLLLAVERDVYQNISYRSFLLYIGSYSGAFGEKRWRLMLQLNPFPRRSWLPLVEVHTS